MNEDLVIYSNKILGGCFLERVIEDEDGFIFVFDNGAKVKVEYYELEEE